jgi:hypothetical protein
MRELTEALCTIKAAPPLSERERQPTETAFVDSFAN